MRFSCFPAPRVECLSVSQFPKRSHYRFFKLFFILVWRISNVGGDSGFFFFFTLSLLHNSSTWQLKKKNNFKLSEYYKAHSQSPYNFIFIHLIDLPWAPIFCQALCQTQHRNSQVNDGFLNSSILNVPLAISTLWNNLPH